MRTTHSGCIGADGHNVTPRKITRLHVLGMLFGLLVLGFGYTRIGGGAAPDVSALPSLEAVSDDDLDGPDQGDPGEGDFDQADPGEDDLGEDLIGEPTDEDLELTELESTADDELFAADPGPDASGIDPLTGRMDDGEPDPAEFNDADLSGEDPEGPVAFVDDEEPIVSGNPIDTGLDGRDGIVIVDGDGGRDDGIIVVDGNGGRDDSIIIVDGDGRDDSDGVIIIDGDGGRDDSIIVVDADGYAFGEGDGDGDTVVIVGDSNIDGPVLSVEPPSPTFEEVAPEPEAAPEPSLPMAEQADVATAEAMLAEWLAANDVSGARIGFSYPDGSRTYLTGGTEEDGTDLDPTGEFLATSVTKTMTASIVFNLVSEGVLQLDEPAPPLGAVPEFEHVDKFSIRQLLQHTSGLAPYQSSPNWRQDMELNALTALQLADDVPLQNTPGAERGYSNSGYLYLGLLSEQYTSTPYHELIQNRITGPLGLEATRIDGARRPGWVGYSAAGLISTVPDLLTWGSALYRDGSVLEPAQLDAMLDVDNEHSTGLGANVICPCGLSDGSLWYTSIGHDGGSVTLQYSPSDAIVTSAKFTESFWTQDLAQRDVHELLRELRAVLTSE